MNDPREPDYQALADEIRIRIREYETLSPGSNQLPDMRSQLKRIEAKCES